MPAHDLAMALRGAYLALHRRTDAATLDHGITADQFVVLMELSRGEALTQTELAARTSSDLNTLRAILVRLEARGLARRRAHPTDRRARSVGITAKGRGVFDRAWAASEGIREQLDRSFTERQLETLVKFLRRCEEAFAPEVHKA